MLKSRGERGKCERLSEKNTINKGKDVMQI